MSGNTPTPNTPVAPANGPEGSQGGEANAAGSTPPPAPNQPAEPAAPTAPAVPTPPESAEQQGQQGLENASRDDLLSTIKDLRRENARDRTTAKQTAAEQAQQSVVEQIGKALGLIKDGEDTPDASKLTEQLTEQTTAAKQAQLELAVYKAAGSHNADADALLDSRAFLAKVADIDPTNAADIESAIKQMVEENPRLQSGQAPPKRSSNPLNNSNSAPVAQTPEELANLIPRGY